VNNLNELTTVNRNGTTTVSATNSYSYDANGNLTSDGTRNFSYNVENQLVSVWVAGAWSNSFAYDGRLRKRIEQDFSWNGSSWIKTNETRYIWDSDVIVQTRDQNNLPVLTFTRGNDLSGTLQKAGGIGGLLAMTANSKLITGDSHATCYYHCDGNGNVTCLIYTNTASMDTFDWGTFTDVLTTNNVYAAKYLYDPYGNLLAESGPLAEANKYRFSSKEWDSQAGLYYYLYRFYDPNLQRWLNRDPLGEIAFQPLWQNQHRFMNDEQDLYEFVINSPTYRVDPDGRFGWLPACCIACGALVAWDLYDAIRDGTCVGYTGADMVECLLQKALSRQGLGDLSSCVGSAIIGGVEGITTPSQTADKVGDCFKCAGMKPYRDLAKLLSCGCCLGSAFSKIPLPAPEPAVSRVISN